MKLDNNQLYKFFLEKGINKLFHANTVTTSISFILKGGLLSRGSIENSGLPQTPQKSDSIDKEYNVWNDIFLDTTDLHSHFNRQNYYGPVLFQFSSIFIIEENHEIWITKKNPTEWSPQMTDEEKYFTSVDEIREEWNKHPLQKKMITIRNIKEPLSWKYLESVLVDNPNVEYNKTVYFQETVKALKSVISNNTDLIGKFSTRSCSNCFCKSNYLEQLKIKDLNKLFLPYNY